MNKIAILYQAKPSPAKAGIQKPMKQGGYSDSGADIAFELKRNGIEVITPVDSPQVLNDLDWVFQDTKEGIQDALNRGAKILWLNTVMYENHAIKRFFKLDIEFVGQTPDFVDIYDDKLTTNKLLEKNGLSTPKSALIFKDRIAVNNLPFDFPCVVKPIRGRGSQGVSLVKNQIELNSRLADLFSTENFGSSVYLEPFLSGQEITITVMPAGNYQIQNKIKTFDKPWNLPAVKRFNHVKGIAPYNGVVAVIQNSIVLDKVENNTPEILDVYKQCEKAAELLNIKSVIRIDCRADENGRYFLFDVNLKPNMTGPSRPHRSDQDSLSLLASRGITWTYFDLLRNMLEQRWKAIF